MVLERVPEARLEALAEAAEAYVEDAFGQRLGLVPVAPTNLPHFILDRYAIWQGALDGRALLLMAVRDNLPPGSGATAQYLKHREIVRHQLRADLVLLLLGRVPDTSDRVQWDGWMFEVVDMDGKRIDKVLATPVETSEEDVDDAALP